MPELTQQQIQDHKKKKLKSSQTFAKGQVSTDLLQMKDLIDRSTVIEMHKQAIYDDDTQSLQITIHYKPKL